MIDRRTLLGGMVAAGTLMGLGGCSFGSAQTNKGADAVPVSWVRYRIGTPAAIDPLYVADEAGRIVVSQLFDTLLRYDFDTQELAPRVASSYQVSEDARTITFTLVSGATFHNGDPVTSASFKRAWERLVRPLPVAGEEGAEASDAAEDTASYSPSAHLLRHVAGYDALRRSDASELVGLRCPDDQTLVVELTSAKADWPYVAAHPALAPIPQAALDDPESFAASPVGNGPFKMKRAWSPKDDVRLTANKACALGAPTIEGVLFVTESDTSTAYKQFQAGDIDVCDVPVDQYEEAEETAGVAADGRTMEPGARLIHSDRPAVTYLVCNTSAAGLSQAVIRRGLSHAIDRETLCEKTLKYSGAPATGPVPPCLAAGDASLWPTCAHDLDAAADLLDTTHPADEAGKRDLSLTLLYRKGGVHKRIADQVASDLALVGCTIQAQALEADELDERYRLGDFELMLATWEPACTSIEAFVYPLLRSGTADGARQSAYANAELDAVLDQVATTVDHMARRDLCIQALGMAAEEMPFIPLLYPAHTKVASARIMHLAIAPDALPDLCAAQK